MKNKKINIAIDGYSSCGKSTLAKAIAKKMGYLFIDSGAMYRAITYYFIKKKLINALDIGNIDLVKELNNVDVQFIKNEVNSEYSIFLNGQNVNEEIRKMEVNQLVSKVASVKEVRQKLVLLQQNIGKNGGVVMDGRDIGSVVFPNAEVKFFLTADPKVRAQRRWLEIQEQNVSFEEVLKNVEERDYLDTSRKESPLIQVKDAIVIDNSNLNQNEQLELALQYIEKKL
ncbi:MAG: (d)CMP kinase [Flavobacteriia bacterium]|nr:(d)CMP kinase [Flavobacteriia bacterium]